MRRASVHSKLIRHLLRPTRGGAAGVVVVFAFLLVLAGRAGLIGIPMALLVISWFFKYAYILFDHTVRGFDEPPTLDIQMVNPVNEQRPLGQVLILGCRHIWAFPPLSHLPVFVCSSCPLRSRFWGWRATS